MLPAIMHTPAAPVLFNNGQKGNANPAQSVQTPQPGVLAVTLPTAIPARPHQTLGMSKQQAPQPSALGDTDAFISSFCDGSDSETEDAVSQRAREYSTPAASAAEYALKIRRVRIEAGIESAMQQRLQKVRRDMVMQNQYMMHSQFAGGYRPFQ